ncbi:2-methylaconitate cis-trans isomerase PrpF [Vibrio cholerae]
MNDVIRVPATYMRGGTSKGIFFRLEDLPAQAQTPGPERDALLMRVIGSPDPYGKQIDGMGGATSSTSKTVIVSPSTRDDHDVDYLFGQVAIGQAFVDWSGNCGNLSAAVGPFAIHAGYLPAERVPHNGVAKVRVWQANIEKTIVVHVPIVEGQVQEMGSFMLDGVTFPAAEIRVDFVDPSGSDSSLFPTGQVAEVFDVPGVGALTATFISAGIPTVFLNARELGLTGSELQPAINGDPELLDKLETIRAHGALRMGLIEDLSEAATRQHTPKLAFVAPPSTYHTSSASVVEAGDIDLLVRAMSMGQLHHAMMGTAAVAIAAAACVPGTLVNQAAGGGERDQVTFGHPSGTLTVGAKVDAQGGQWCARQVSMGRSARILMEGVVRVPSDVFHSVR